MSILDRFRLNESQLTYAACRIASLQTVDRLLKEDEADDASTSGFLAEIPLLKETATQVQLELLAVTWRKGCGERSFPPTPVDECVLYAALQRASRLIVDEPHTTQRLLGTGPRVLDRQDLGWLAARLRTLQLTLPFSEVITACQQAEDVESLSSDRYNGVRRGSRPQIELFELLGRWRVNPNLAWGFQYLLTRHEILDITRFLHSTARF